MREKTTGQSLGKGSLSAGFGVFMPVLQLRAVDLFPFVATSGDVSPRHLLKELFSPVPRQEKALYCTEPNQNAWML